MALAETATRGRGDRFKADGDVHVVPEDLVSSAITCPCGCPYGIASPGRRGCGCSFWHQQLHRDGRLDRADDAWKLQQEAVAGVLHKPAAMIEDVGISRFDGP